MGLRAELLSYRCKLVINIWSLDFEHSVIDPERELLVVRINVHPILNLSINLLELGPGDVLAFLQNIQEVLLDMAGTLNRSNVVGYNVLKDISRCTMSLSDEIELAFILVGFDTNRERVRVTHCRSVCWEPIILNIGLGVWLGMTRVDRDEKREDRIRMEVVVDAYTAHEQALGWYYYLEDKMDVPFEARCIEVREVSLLEEGETVRVEGMSSVEACQSEMFVTVDWDDRELGVPLAQLDPIKGSSDTEEAVADWHYWVGRGYQFIDN